MSWNWLFTKVGSLELWQVLLNAAGILLLIFLRRFWSWGLVRLIYGLLTPVFRHKVPLELFLNLIRPPLYAMAFTLALYVFQWTLDIFGEKPSLRSTIDRLAIALLVIWVAWLVTRLLRLFTLARITQEEDVVRWQLISLGVSIATVVIFLVAVAIALQHLFLINVTSILASLGVGGLAVALAAKETLEQFLGAVTIVADTPFKVGHLIRFQNTTGKVERVGLRSTRIRTLDGTLLVVPNKQLVDNPIENFTEVQTRRILIDVGLIYSTPLEVMEAIKKDLEAYFASEPSLVEPQFIRFMQYADSALTLRVLTYVKVDAENDILYWQDQVNKKILETVRRYMPQTDFAFPTRTLYVIGNEVSKV
ncbi:MAG: mechanosensitive ion channel family protein [Bacteroidia bacterium]